MTKADKILRKEIIHILELDPKGNHLIRYEDALRAVQKALTIPVVVGRSEQLVCPHCKRKNIEIQHKSQSFKCKDCKEGWAN